MARPGRPRKAGSRWFAVHTNARAEWLAHRLLRHEGYETLYLHYRDTVNHARRTVEVLKPYFARYLFVCISSTQSIYRVNKTMGVSTVVYLGGEPLDVPVPVIEELKERGDENGLVGLPAVEKERRKLLAQGQSVKIIDGPLTGLLAVVALDKGHEIRIWLQMFKGLVSADVLPEHVSPALRRYSR